MLHDVVKKREEDWEKKLQSISVDANQQVTGYVIPFGDAVDFVRSIRRQSIIAVLEEIERWAKERKINCEDAGYELPDDPSLGADQARNYTLKELQTFIREQKKLIEEI